MKTINTNVGPAVLVTARRGVFAVNCRPSDSGTVWMRAQLSNGDKLPAVPCTNFGAALKLGKVVMS